MGTALFKSRFCRLGGGGEHPCLSPDAGGASLGCEPASKAAKSQDLNTALIFWFFFIKEKEQNTTISKLTKQTLAKIQVKLNGIGCVPAGSLVPAGEY